MPNIVFIVGPTATGKTETAFTLARRINAEIVSADSMTIYKEPAIITSKPSPEMLGQVQHHFVGIISVTQEYSVFDYYARACALINDFYRQKKPVLVCGGTGLYSKALLDGIFEGAGKDEAFRKDLEEQARIQGKEYLHNELKKVDIETARKISVNDVKRIIRALEVYHCTGSPLSKKKKEAKGLWGTVPIKIFGLRLKREALYAKIDKRVDEMFNAGAIAEVERLGKLHLSLTAEKIIGIKEIGGYLKGEYTIEKAKEQMKQNTRRFAKRQMTWFKPDKRIQWIDIDTLTTEDIVKNIAQKIEADTR
ncbi:MAG: tRNA (adenosine(37)-N6)-dimethylallyltransferase MiaA [Candidatus Omnitrophica bacterium]|nr:tRNA (adenosine(37)-N6)-dimethylallyltransferase MiaA [Candidatus Omnitrophota bacterium]